MTTLLNTASTTPLLNLPLLRILVNVRQQIRDHPLDLFILIVWRVLAHTLLLLAEWLEVKLIAQVQGGGSGFVITAGVDVASWLSAGV
jgi:hypothetical protein